MRESPKANIPIALRPVLRSSLGRAIWWRFPTNVDNLRFPTRTILPSADKSELLCANPMLTEDGFDSVATSASVARYATVSSFAELMQQTRTTSVLVVRSGRLVYEKYYGHTATSMLGAFSISKVVLSSMVGRAIADGYLSTLDELVVRKLPELTPKLNGVTVRHLLNMTSGLKYDHRSLPWSDVAKAYYAPDRWSAFQRYASLASAPDTVWKYNDFSPVPVAELLHRATSESLADLSSRYIFDPLGMADPGAWLLDRPGGRENAAGGLYVTGRTLAKFGVLHQNFGQFNGRQVLPEQWVAAATRLEATDKPILRNVQTHSFKPKNMAYKLGWWIPSSGESTNTNGRFVAIGHLGQYIYVDRELDVVVVRTGADWGALGRYGWLELLGLVAAHASGH